MSVSVPAPAGCPTWFDHTSPDATAARAFYGAVMGWSFSEPAGPEMGGYAMALVDGKVAAGLGTSPEGVPSAWTVYFATEDAAATAATAAELGATVIQAPMEIPGSGTMAILADPTGAVFGLWQGGNHKGAAVASTDEGGDIHGAMAWCEVNTRDRAAAVTFYSKLFGLTGAPMEGMDYTMFQHGGQPVFGALQMTKEWGEIPPHFSAYFSVDDTDAAALRAVEAGGAIMQPAFDTPFGRICVIKDPFDAFISVIQPPSAS